MEGAEHPELQGGEVDQQELIDALTRSAGQPIAAFNPETDAIAFGVSHGFRDDAVWIRDAEGDMSKYKIVEWQFVIGDQALGMALSENADGLAFDFIKDNYRAM